MIYLVLIIFYLPNIYSSVSENQIFDPLLNTRMSITVNNHYITIQCRATSFYVSKTSISLMCPYNDGFFCYTDCKQYCKSSDCDSVFKNCSYTLVSKYEKIFTYIIDASKINRVGKWQCTHLNYDSGNIVIGKFVNPISMEEFNKPIITKPSIEQEKKVSENPNVSTQQNNFWLSHLHIISIVLFGIFMLLNISRFLCVISRKYCRKNSKMPISNYALPNNCNVTNRCNCSIPPVPSGSSKGRNYTLMQFIKPSSNDNDINDSLDQTYTFVPSHDKNSIYYNPIKVKQLIRDDFCLPTTSESNNLFNSLQRNTADNKEETFITNITTPSQSNVDLENNI